MTIARRTLAETAYYPPHPPAAVSAALLNIGPLVSVITDPTIRAIAVIAITGALQFLLKLLGGPTAPVGGLAAAPGASPNRVSWWAS